MDKLAIVVVTYKRQELLQQLFESILQSTIAPWRIIITDNENSAQTEEIVQQFSKTVDEQWGSTDPDIESNTHRVIYQNMTENTGGSGGFHAGVRRAYQLGAEWFWLMDDDVAIEPRGIERLNKWTDKHDVIQGQRYNFDGTPFYWQYSFLTSLGIPNPIAPSKFGHAGYKVMNTACFEGGLFKRSVIQKIGLPDKRFFIYWDDTIYGYLASKVTNPIIIPDFVMRRTRTINNWDIAGKRKLNSTSDMNRYYIMRNRGYMARYFMAHGDFSASCFALGTFLTFIKECIRLVMVDKSYKTGLSALFRGWFDSRAIFHDGDWKPMPPLEK
ncbi:MAG: glycosyltransferase family 2 protein [Aeriscardovia sp.]|nr:glycosyltransferase family 2 protein [Aeriscardovia sp.]